MTGHDPSHFAINQITTPRWTMPQAIEGYAAQGIGVWRHFLDADGVAATARHMRDAGMWAASLCTSAWVSHTDPAKLREAIDGNRRILDQAAAIGAPRAIMVRGGLPPGSWDLAGQRARICDSSSSSRPMPGRSACS